MPTLRRMPGPAGLLTLLSCAAVLGSCGRDQPGEESAVTNNIAQAPRPTPVVDPPLNREQLLLAAVRAASAYAAGIDDSEAQRGLDGKRFELRIRFGCGDGDDEERGWLFDEESRTLRLRVAPDISSDDPIVAKIATEAFESVEGFWLHRPWLLTAACPAIRPPSPVEAVDEDSSEQAVPSVDEPSLQDVSQRRFGIAQFSTPTDSRTTRRKQRPYESTKILSEGQGPSRQGYNFIISGRLRALPNSRVIACSYGSREGPPSCIISVHSDRTWIERADNRELIAEWTS